MEKYINTKLISNYIAEHNLTIVQFCKQCGISTTTYYKVMANECAFGLNTLFKIAKSMRVQICQLFNR